MMQRSYFPHVPGRISPLVPEGWAERVRKHLEEVGRMANNMKLEEAIAHLDESLNDQSHDWGCEECKQEHVQLREWLVELKERRAADVRPVARGKWIRGNESATSPARDSYTCSVCGDKALAGFCGRPARTNYCPSCGADMREETVQ